MKLVAFLCNADQTIKEALEREPKRYLSTDDQFTVVKQISPDYIAQKVLPICTQPGIDRDYEIYVVVLMLNITADQIDSLRQTFPALLFLNIGLQRDGYGQPRVNHLLRELMFRLAHARKLFRMISKEVRERDSKTPLLLPIRNFHSDNLNKLLIDVQSLNPRQTDYDPEFRAVVRRAEAAGLRAHREGPKAFFENSRSIRFYGPSKAGPRHAVARYVYPHRPACMVNACFRLGARYDMRFHYDCEHPNKQIAGTFFDCHGDGIRVPARSHVNIAPNDHVRL
jgi:hypothetical protein